MSSKDYLLNNCIHTLFVNYFFLKILLKFLAKGGKLAILGVIAVLSAIGGIIKAFFSLFSGKPRSEHQMTTLIEELEPEPEPKAAFIDKVKELADKGRARDAIVLIRSEKRGKIEDVELAKLYYNLLNDTHQIPEMLKHSKGYIDLLTKKGRTPDAYEVYRECLVTDSKFTPSPLSLFNFTQWLAKGGETKQAMRACVQFTRAYPDHAVIPDVYFLLAKLFNEKLNDKIKAQKTIHWMIKKFPEHKQTSTARSYLEAIG